MTQTYDIVYILGKGVLEDDFALRYSLRSAARNATGLRNVAVIGECPGWMRPDIYVPQGDPHKRCKDANMIGKVLRACTVPEISDPFVRMSDDFYFLRPTTLEEIQQPYLQHNQTPSGGGARWRQRMRDTLDYCRSQGYPPRIYADHVPTAVSKELFASVMLGVDYATGKGAGYLIQLYQNVIHANVDVPVWPDGYSVHLHAPHSRAELDKLINHRYLNHNDTALNKDLRGWLMERFPVPCRWEAGE